MVGDDVKVTFLEHLAPGLACVVADVNTDVGRAVVQRSIN